VLDHRPVDERLERLVVLDRPRLGARMQVDLVNQVVVEDELDIVAARTDTEQFVEIVLLGQCDLHDRA
jgi:hypothetical protein